jgi:hypothetical protein
MESLAQLYRRSIVQRVRPLRHHSLGPGQILHAPLATMNTAMLGSLPLPVEEAVSLAWRRRRLCFVHHGHLYRAWNSPAVAEATSKEHKSEQKQQQN